MAYSTNKTDQLFRRKLEELEVAPSVDSWKTVKGQIQEKPTRAFYFMWAAASVVVLISVGYLLYTFPEQSGQPLLSVVDHPVVPAESLIEIPNEQPEKSLEVSIPSEKRTITHPEKRTNQESVATVAPIVGSESEPFTLIAVERIDNPRLEVSLSVDFAASVLYTEITQLPTVKITYIASNPSELGLPISDRLSKLITKAQQVSPGDLLADIRDAKDQLLSRN